MEIHKDQQGTEFNSEPALPIQNLPVFHPHFGNESGINYRNVEIKSHSFAVRNASFLAGENIIFEPGSLAEEE
jgi:hypothetical protein